MDFLFPLGSRKFSPISLHKESLPDLPFIKFPQGQNELLVQSYPHLGWSILCFSTRMHNLQIIHHLYLLFYLVFLEHHFHYGHSFSEFWRPSPDWDCPAQENKKVGNYNPPERQGWGPQITLAITYNNGDVKDYWYDHWIPDPPPNFVGNVCAVCDS